MPERTFLSIFSFARLRVLVPKLHCQVDFRIDTRPRVMASKNSHSANVAAGSAPFSNHASALFMDHP